VGECVETAASLGIASRITDEMQQMGSRAVAVVAGGVKNGAMWSFILPAHDEAPLIGATLDAIRIAANDCGLAHELVVVDDDSTDGTAQVARAHGARVVSVAFRHIAATRNAGAAAAAGTRLCFVDADTLIDSRVLRAAISALDAGAVGGGCAVVLDGRVRWPVRMFTATLMHVFRWMRVTPGCFVFCTREAFDATGGFDTNYFAGEDVAFSRALATVGRVRILRESVRTSDRKLRTFGVLDHLRLMLRFALRGRRILRSRDHLALWYARRRH
jgi:glycosyltransferase involved in cell wall biosynthesis